MLQYWFSILLCMLAHTISKNSQRHQTKTRAFLQGRCIAARNKKRFSCMQIFHDMHARLWYQKKEWEIVKHSSFLGDILKQRQHLNPLESQARFLPLTSRNRDLGFLWLVVSCVSSKEKNELYTWSFLYKRLFYTAASSVHFMLIYNVTILKYCLARRKARPKRMFFSQRYTFWWK